MLDPGLDKHLWERWWQQFEEDVQTSPGEALSELDGLILQMLEARGYAVDDPVAREGYRSLHDYLIVERAPP